MDRRNFFDFSLVDAQSKQGDKFLLIDSFVIGWRSVCSWECRIDDLVVSSFEFPNFCFDIITSIDFIFIDETLATVHEDRLTSQMDNQDHWTMWSSLFLGSDLIFAINSDCSFHSSSLAISLAISTKAPEFVIQCSTTTCCSISIFEIQIVIDKWIIRTIGPCAYHFFSD